MSSIVTLLLYIFLISILIIFLFRNNRQVNNKNISNTLLEECYLKCDKKCDNKYETDMMDYCKYKCAKKCGNLVYK